MHTYVDIYICQEAEIEFSFANDSLDLDNYLVGKHVNLGHLIQDDIILLI